MKIASEREKNGSFEDSGVILLLRVSVRKNSNQQSDGDFGDSWIIRMKEELVI